MRNLEVMEEDQEDVTTLASRPGADLSDRQEFAPIPANRQLPADQHPELVYMASLAPGSRRGVRSSLQICAELLSSGRCDWQSFPWQALGPQHTQALRSELADRYAATTANKMLASIRGVLRAAWELGQVDTDRYQRAISFRAVRGQTLPRGRSISQGSFGLCSRPAFGTALLSGCVTLPYLRFSTAQA